MLKVFCNCCGGECDMNKFRFEATADYYNVDLTSPVPSQQRIPVKKIFHACEKCYKTLLEKPLHKSNDKEKTS